VKAVCLGRPQCRVQRLSGMPVPWLGGGGRGRALWAVAVLFQRRGVRRDERRGGAERGKLKVRPVKAGALLLLWCCAQTALPK
jgi:hypothetical protein